MINFLNKIIGTLQKIVNFFKADKEASTPVPAPPREEVKPTPAVQETKPTTPAPEAPEATGDDPAVTNPSAGITSFLWKPLSDTNPKVTVITVSADEIKSDDLRVRILNKKGKDMEIITVKNKYSTARGNKLPQDKLGRINFKPGLTAEQFMKAAPIKIIFYTEIAGKKSDILTCGNAVVEIKDTTKRWVIKNGKLTPDPK